MGDVLSFEEDFSGTRPINSTDAIEDGGLPGTIRSDDGINGPFLHFKAHIAQRSDAAKGDRQVFDFKNRVHNFKKNSSRAGEAFASPICNHSLRHALCPMPACRRQALCDSSTDYFVILIQSVSFSIFPSGFTFP